MAYRVKDRWYGDYRGGRKQDAASREFKGEAQYTLEQLYITPLTHRRRFTEDGQMQYVPLERNLNPTGIRVMDDYLRFLSGGCADTAVFAGRYGARIGDIDSLVFLLTGMRGVDFRQAYQRRMADELLRYTSLPVADIARLCGYGSRGNFYFAYLRDFGCPPSDRRLQLQHPGEKDMFKIVG